MTRDYHVHTRFCDGKNTPEEMVLKAIEKGMEALGFSAHSYTFFDESYCLKRERYNEYKAEINRLKEKYKGTIDVYCGIEMDMFSHDTLVGYEYVIVDYGCNYNTAKDSFLMCPCKIIVGSTGWWKLHSYVAFMVNATKEKSSDRWIYTTTNPINKHIRYLEKEFHKEIISIPYEPDPFFLKNSIDFWHHLTEKIL